MHTEPVTLTGRELRWLADNYEQAQRLRISVGERIRAVLQGRDQSFVGLEEFDGADAEVVLQAISKGETLGPVLMLGRSYKRYHDEERATFDDMMTALEHHPAWHWMDGVKGIGPTLGCKILARLDVEKAEHVSSFWKHAGLATVPGTGYKCVECGLKRGFPVSYKVTGKHQMLGTQKKCKGSLEATGDVRVAQPRNARGEKRSYDAYLKKVLWLAAMSFLKVGGPYEEFYRSERAKAEVERPYWADGGKHYLALRKTQKLFLSHLWQTWRSVVGLKISEPYAVSHLGHDDILDPWDFSKAIAR
jgi:hypothetical protein